MGGTITNSRFSAAIWEISNSWMQAYTIAKIINEIAIPPIKIARNSHGFLHFCSMLDSVAESMEVPAIMAYSMSCLLCFFKLSENKSNQVIL